jgi:hypothetical protein
MCVILETLLVPQSHWTDLAPELGSLGGALLTDSTQERHAEIHVANQNFVGGGLIRQILTITCVCDSNFQPSAYWIGFSVCPGWGGFAIAG